MTLNAAHPRCGINEREASNMRMVAVEAWSFARWNLAVYVAACIATLMMAGPDMPMIG